MPDAKMLLVVSDIHCGSKVGLLPPGCKDVDGAEYGLNAYQRWMWNQWVKAMKWVDSVVGDEPLDVVIAGDVAEGVHHKSVEVIDADPAQHSAVAVVALQPLCDRAKRCWMVQGTECHTRTSEHYLGKGLGCEPNAEGGYSWPNVKVEYNGVLTSISHHMSSSIRPWTEASGLGIALNAERLECARAGHRVPEVVVRAHRHRNGLYSDGYGMIVCCAPWQGSTRYVHEIKPDAIPQCGLMIIDYRKCGPKGVLPYVQNYLRTAEERSPANRK